MLMTLVFVFAFALPIFGADFTLKVGTIVTETHPDYIVMHNVFKPLVETNSKGRIASRSILTASLAGTGND